MKNKNASHETANTTTKKNSGKNLSDAPPTKKYVSGLQTKRKDILKRFSTLVQKIFTVVHVILQD